MLKHHLEKDKIEHKVISYVITRKLAEFIPLEISKRITYLIMSSKEILDLTGLGKFEAKDIKADEKGIEEASADIVKNKPYRYNVSENRIIKDVLRYLHLI